MCLPIITFNNMPLRDVTDARRMRWTESVNLFVYAFMLFFINSFAGTVIKIVDFNLITSSDVSWCDMFQNTYIRYILLQCFVDVFKKLTNYRLSTRFAAVSPEDVNKLIREKTSINTNKTTDSLFHVLGRYCTEKMIFF